MKIAVVGPGAMGCLFGALFGRAGHDVWLVDRSPERAALLARQGLRLNEGEAATVIPIRATADAAGIGPQDLVILCVKAYDTAEALRRCLPLIGPQTAVLSLQNGLGNAEAIAAQVQPAQAAAGATAEGAILLGPGEVAHTGTGVSQLAPLDPAQRWPAERGVSALESAGLQARLVMDAPAVIWSKLVLNAAVNPVTALWNVPNGGVPERPDLMELATAAAQEAAEVARRKGIALLYDDPVEELRRLCRRTQNNRSSMLQDVRQGRRTEIDAINGAIVDEANRLGLPVPVNAMLTARIRALRP